MVIPLKRCVYTALTGGYEMLNEQPAAATSSLPFICFTDNPSIRSQSWQIRPIEGVFGQDNVRNQRACKLRPHYFLSDFDASIYIDNTVILKLPPEELFAIADLSSGLSLPAHSFRPTLADEFAEVARDQLDDPTRVGEQLAHYRQLYPQILGERPFWNGILLRDHRSLAMVGAMETWLAHVYRYSRRDQLSAQVAFHCASLRPHELQLDNHDSPFHTWPKLASRNIAARTCQTNFESKVLSAQLLRAEQEAVALSKELAALMVQHRKILASKSWRMTQPLRSLVQHIMNWQR